MTSNIFKQNNNMDFKLRLAYYFREKKDYS